MELNIGISTEDRQQIADGLSKLLADSYSLYLKTHNYHWNVEGPLFNTLHLMFEGHYTELATAVDEIAERIRALGVKAPGSYTAFTDRPRSNQGRGGSQRRADCGPADPADADSRKKCLDAAKHAGLINRKLTGDNHVQEH